MEQEARYRSRLDSENVGPADPDFKVAFVSPGIERTTGSGATYYMAQQLRRVFHELVEVPAPSPSPSLIRRALWSVSRRLTGRTVRWKSTRAYAVTAARCLERRLGECNPDLVFGALAGWDLAMLRVNAPMVNCTDSAVPVAAKMGGYRSIDTMSKRGFETAMRLERDMARRCALHVVATRWVAQSLSLDYSVPPERVFVVPWGAKLRPLGNSGSRRRYTK
jgi:hypothetical protein